MTLVPSNVLKGVSKEESKLLPTAPAIFDVFYQVVIWYGTSFFGLLLLFVQVHRFE